MRHLRLIVAAAVLAAVLGVPAAPAQAKALDRLGLVAEQLKRDPLVVSDALVREIPPAEVRRLRAAIKAMPVRTYVVIVPSVSVPGTGEYPPDDSWPTLLRDAVGKDGVYVVSSGKSSVDAGVYGVRTPVPLRDAERASTYDLSFRVKAGTAVRYFLRVLRGGPRLPRDQRDQIPESEGGAPIAPVSVGGDEDRGQDGPPDWLVTLLALMSPGVAYVAYRLTKRQLGGSVSEAVIRAQLVGTPLGADEIAKRADVALDELTHALEHTADPSPQALDLAEAARRASRRTRDGKLDRLGVVVLSALAREALEGRAPRPRCYFDPRHGVAGQTTRWTERSETVTVPTCKACARAVRRGDPPRSLLIDGRPYWEHRNVWSDTGFGALDLDLNRALLEADR